MNALIPIFIVGFFILGTYKVFELFAKRKERILLIEKLASLCAENKEDKEKQLKIQLPLIVGNDSGFWPLRISLLLIGIGLGFLTALFIQLGYYSELARDVYDNVALVNLASISFFGGIGLLIAFLIEQKGKSNLK